ncbi:MAG: PAQR family membrane homeostasis protein TrhA [Campylobacteraceae bacterium]
MYKGEKFNSISHLIGFMLSVAALVVLVVFSALKGDVFKVVSFAIYGGTLVILYGFSTLYHSIRHAKAKKVLQKFDHISIYLLIAGSYTPFALVSMRGAWGWSIFGVVWGLCVFGIVQELFQKSEKRILSLVIYVLMGWLVVVAIKPLVASLATGGVVLLVLGGLFYTGGIYFFINDERVRHYHGIWHLFVLAGSICHFFTFLFFVL